MSRPAPTVLLEQTNTHTYMREQIISSDGIFAVYYNNSPINLKTQNSLTRYPGPKYKKASFSNSGPAINLAKRLNKKYSTTLFTVVKLSVQETIFP